MRRIERIPIVMKYFRQNTKILAKYCEIKQKDAKLLIENHYEDIFYQWIQYPDLRLSQLLVNIELIPDKNGIFFKEEIDFLIEGEYIKKESITFWGTRGLGNEFKEWLDKKPKLDDELEAWNISYYKGFSKEEIFADKYHYWMLQKPEPIYKTLDSLDSSHISAILETQTQISPTLRQTFQKILDERQKSL